MISERTRNSVLRRAVNLCTAAGMILGIMFMFATVTFEPTIYGQIGVTLIRLLGVLFFVSGFGVFFETIRRDFR